MTLEWRYEEGQVLTVTLAKHGVSGLTDIAVIASDTGVKISDPYKNRIQFNPHPNKAIVIWDTVQHADNGSWDLTVIYKNRWVINDTVIITIKQSKYYLSCTMTYIFNIRYALDELDIFVSLALSDHNLNRSRHKLSYSVSI